MRPEFEEAERLAAETRRAARALIELDRRGEPVLLTERRAVRAALDAASAAEAAFWALRPQGPGLRA